MSPEQDLLFLEEAIREAHLAGSEGEVPIGAVIVSAEGEILARGRNAMEHRQDATAHAEMFALREAARRLDSWRLDGCTLYASLEPCPMCAGAILGSRIARVVFGAYDHRLGACGTHWNIPGENPIHRQVEVIGGLRQEECANLLRDFFRELREGTRPTSKARRMPE